MPEHYPELTYTFRLSEPDADGNREFTVVRDDGKAVLDPLILLGPNDSLEVAFTVVAQLDPAGGYHWGGFDERLGTEADADG